MAGSSGIYRNHLERLYFVVAFTQYARVQTYARYFIQATPRLAARSWITILHVAGLRQTSSWPSFNKLR
jgi:hypothetical protein